MLKYYSIIIIIDSKISFELGLQFNLLSLII